jgi:hypothetical protein
LEKFGKREMNYLTLTQNIFYLMEYKEFLNFYYYFIFFPNNAAITPPPPPSKLGLLIFTFVFKLIYSYLIKILFSFFTSSFIFNFS